MIFSDGYDLFMFRWVVSSLALFTLLFGLTAQAADDKPIGEIAFVSDRDNPGQASEIYVMNADGTNQRRLTHDNGADTYPAWSPDGTQIVYQLGLGDKQGLSIIYKDGTVPKLATDTGNNITPFLPSWSPDGHQIAFTGIVFPENGQISCDADGSCHSNFPDPNPNIYLVNADFSSLRKLTDTPASDTGPHWSPDGHQIAFLSTQHEDSEIYVMDADGSNPRNLTNNPANDDAFAWSHAGSNIAFASNRDGGYELYIMDADGSNVHRLTHGATDSDMLYSTWSPDDHQLAFVSSQKGNEAIDVINADGTNLNSLTTQVGRTEYPQWSPDGKQIVFMSDRDGDFEIYRIDTDGQNLIQLTNNNGIDVFPVWRPVPILGESS